MESPDAVEEGSENSFDPGLETGYVSRPPREGPPPVEIGAQPFDPGPEIGIDRRRAKRGERKRRERQEAKSAARLEAKEAERRKADALEREAAKRERREAEAAARREAEEESRLAAERARLEAAERDLREAEERAVAEAERARREASKAVRRPAAPARPRRAARATPRPKPKQQRRPAPRPKAQPKPKQQRRPAPRPKAQPKPTGAKPSAVRAKPAPAARGKPKPSATAPRQPQSLKWPTAKLAGAALFAALSAMVLGSVLGLPTPLKGSDSKLAGVVALPGEPLDSGIAASVARGPIHPVLGNYDYGEKAARFGAARSGHTHEGQDIFSKSGTPLVAVRDGVVVDGEREDGRYSGGRGNYVVIYSPAEDQSYVYMHMLKPSPVRIGDRVHAGQVIGQMGCTGSCFGTHLHFEVRLGKATLTAETKPIDPLPFLRGLPQAPAGVGKPD